jgi:membrane protease YdiL (CAAX protease family)
LNKSLQIMDLRDYCHSRQEAGTRLAFYPPAMSPDLRSSAERFFPLRALALFAVFMGAAMMTLRLTSGSTLGALLGPIAAQAAMGVVILMGSRVAPFSGQSLRRSIPRRQLRVAPLVLIALGGFLLQATLVAGFQSLTPSSIPGVRPEMEAPLMWLVILLTSVVGAPLLEEVFFRGMLLPLLSRRNLVLGLVTSAALFGLAHGFDTPFRAVPTFLQGLVLGGVMLLTGRLRAAVLLHALNNALVLAATLWLVLHPPVGVGGGSGAADVLFLPACALAALLLLGWGFFRIARQPRLAAS